MTEHFVVLADGRRLAYTQFGPAGGWPVVYFHGTPSSRLELTQLKAFGVDAELHLTRQGLRLLAIDRPGMGLSSFNPKGSFLSCANDVAELLRELQITTCSTLCWSGGGPYALALAHMLPHIVQDVWIFCGFTLSFSAEVQKRMYRNKWYFRAARQAPKVMQWMMEQTVRRPLQTPPPRALTDLHPVDYDFFGQRHLYREMTRTSIKEACRNGARGPIYEAGLYFGDFGFELDTLAQPVHYWWGHHDRMVAEVHARAVTELIPNGTLETAPGEGHLSIFVRRFPEALRRIAAAHQP